MNIHLNLIFLFVVTAFVKTAAQDEFTLLTSIHGEKDGDKFVNVDAIGDINGDGFDDFIVGASGKYVKLYLGSSPFDTLNCIKFLQGTYRRVFASGAGRGDLNGDGYNDFIINTTYYLNDFRVEIYYGGKDVDTTADVIITNNIWYSNFGASSITGDLNNDGYDDLVITAPNDDYDRRGRVYIYYGGTEMDNVCDVYFEGKEGSDEFGTSASIIGDVNDDGFDDLLVGTPQDGAPVALKQRGKAYLFFGGDSIGFNNSVEFVGDTTLPYSSFGRVVSGLGDINNDGFDDFGIMSLDYVNIYFGKTLEVILKITSEKAFWSSATISNGFDLNKDGYNDFIIGYEHSEGQYTLGAELYLGGYELSASPVAKLPEKNENGYYGRNIAICGDINKDGQDEILVGEGDWDSAGIIRIYTYGKVSSVESSPTVLPNDFIIKQNYPNPFNPVTAITYELKKELDITIDVLNITGEKVKTLFSGIQSVGSYNITWDGLDRNNFQVSSGVYFLRISAEPISSFTTCQQKVIKMILLR